MLWSMSLHFLIVSVQPAACQWKLSPGKGVGYSLQSEGSYNSVLLRNIEDDLYCVVMTT